MTLIKGAHYRSGFLYDALALLKLRRQYALRHQIAASFISPAQSVIDVCSGPGRLRNFIPQDCAYTAVDASPEFLAILRKQGAHAIAWNLHMGWPAFVPVSDVITMVIALGQFRETSADALLESFKKAARCVVIVEEVLGRARGERSLIQRGMNYLCATDYYVPVASWYTRPEFEHLMQGHGYQCQAASSRYMVGSYGF